MTPAVKASSWGRRSSDRFGGVLEHSLNRAPSSCSKQKMRPCPGFCPCYGVSCQATQDLAWLSDRRRIFSKQSGAGPPVREVTGPSLSSVR
jgi:hypothetical protein